jgi:hypothetical protein
MRYFKFRGVIFFQWLRKIVTEFERYQKVLDFEGIRAKNILIAILHEWIF